MFLFRLPVVYPLRYSFAGIRWTTSFWFGLLFVYPEIIAVGFITCFCFPVRVVSSSYSFAGGEDIRGEHSCDFRLIEGEKVRLEPDRSFYVDGIPCSGHASMGVDLC